MNPVSASTSKPVMAHSCVRCFDRKVKCSRDYPTCTACIKHGQPCEYRAPAKPQRRKRHVQDTVLSKRLKHYEQLLQQNGINVATSEDSNAGASGNDHDDSKELEISEDTASPVTSSMTDATRQFSTSQLVFNQGRSHYLEKYDIILAYNLILLTETSNLWTRVTEEVSLTTIEFRFWDFSAYLHIC
jgi:hypothetical protein